jgi:hypothetical protein
MAQDFTLRYPLIQGQGNFGSRDGDPPAAYRYTEAKLAAISELLLSEIDQGTVDFGPNYDNTVTEPARLPARLPFVLLNGSVGIAVGMACDIPPHNLREVAAAAAMAVTRPDASHEDLLALMPGPDFPDGGQVISSRDVDGQHIQTLLLTLFFRHFPQLIARGHVFIACPPLYRMDVDSAGKKRQAKKLYAMDAQELASWEDRLRKEGYTQWKVGRFKGLGEMDPSELWETTLNPDTRRLLQINLPEDARDAATERFNMLMAKARSGARREWMERRGNEVDEVS